MKLFETNFSKEKPELIAAPVLLSTFKFQLSAEKLSQSYSERYKKQISFDNITDNIIQIDLPF